MANDTDSSGSGSIHERGRMTRSATHALSKKVHLATPSTSPNLKSDRHDKRSSPSQQNPLRRSERTSQHSSSDPNSRSSGSKKLDNAKESPFEAAERDTGASSNRKVRRMDARAYRAVLEKPKRDCHLESRSKDRSTRDGGVPNEGKVDKCLKENRLVSDKNDKGILPSGDAKAKEMRAESRLSGPVKELLENNVTSSSLVPSNGSTTHEISGAPERVWSDRCGEETPQMSTDSKLNEILLRKCDGQDMDEKMTSSKRKRTMVDMDSDVSATLADDDNCNMVVDAAPSRLCDNIVETSGPCSKRIRRISLPDVQKDKKELTNNFDQPSSKSNGENLSTRNREDQMSEGPQGNVGETDKIRKEQRISHFILKPQIAKLCEILLLPDNVKIMVESCLEYTMNNYRICDCTTPESILQAFQLSLCWTAASLLDHKFDFEASFMLAKRHLKFVCDKDVVNEIKLKLWDLKDNFLLLRGNSNASGSRKASDSTNGVDSHSQTEVTPEVELVEKDISKNINTKYQWRKLLRMQKEEKRKLEKDIENEQAEFETKCRVEWVMQYRSANEKKVFSSDCDRIVEKLNRHHEIRLKDLEAKQLEARQKFQELCAPDELLNLVAAKELESRVKYLTDDQAQPHNAPKAFLSDHVAKGKCFDNIAKAMTRNNTGVGLSEALETNSSLDVSCSSVELQNLVKHSGADGVDGMASKNGPVPGNKCQNIAENEYVSCGNVVSRNSNSREQCSDGATNIADEACESFSHKSHNDCGQDTEMFVRLSSNEEIRDGEKSDVPSGEVALAVHETRSNDDQVEVPFSRQKKLEGTILSKPVRGLSIEVKATGFSDDVKNMASNSQSPEEHIPTANTTCTPNCDNAAQTLEADDSNGSNNADAMELPFSNERTSSLNSKSPREKFQSVDVTCMPTRKNSVQIHEDADGNGSNNVLTPGSPLIDERNVDGTTVSVSDTEVHGGMSGFTPSSTEQISGSVVNASVLHSVLSRPRGAENTSNSPDANAIIILLNQSSIEKDNLNGVSSSIPAGQIPVEVSQANRDGDTVSVLDRETAVGKPGSVCTDYPENVSPLNSSSEDQISDGGSVLGGDLSPRPSCTASPSNGQPGISSLLNPSSSQQQNPDRVLLNVCNEQIPVVVPENSQEEAARQLEDGAVVDKTTTSDQHEGMCRSMTDNTLSQETPVSRPDDLGESPEQVQPLSSVASPVDQDTSREMQNSLVSSQPGDQSNHVSTVIEPPEQEQQLPSEGFPSSNQDLSNFALVTGVEDRPSSEDTLSGFIPEASPQVQSQAAEQPASNLELGSHSGQVVDPASNSDLDSLMPGGVRILSSDMRNWPTPSEINNHPVQIATQSASGIVPRFGHDPFILELGKIRKLADENMKKHEYMKLKLKEDYEKEVEELRRKYENKLMEKDVEFQKTGKDLERQQDTVRANKLLADAFRAISMPQAQDVAYIQQLVQLSIRRSASSSSHPPHPVLESSNASTSSRTTVPPIQATSYGPRVASLQNSYATTNSWATVPPMQATYNTTGIFSSISARPVDVNTICPPSGNLQSGGEIRAAPPHLQFNRPSTLVPPSTFSTVLNGTPTQPASGNIPVNSSLFPHRPGPATQPASSNIPVNSSLFPHRLPGPATQPASSNIHVNSSLFPHRLPRPTTQTATGNTPVNSPLFPHRIPGPTIQPTVNVPVNSPSFSHKLTGPRPTAFQSDPHRRHQPEATGGLSTPSLPSMDLLTNANSQPRINLPNAVLRTSDSLNRSTSSSLPANSTQQATPDVVYLSDDE